MVRVAAFLLAAVAFPSPGVLAQDHAAVLGAWEMTMETPRGTATQVFNFIETDDGLAGTVSTRMGDANLENVTYEDGTLRFEVVRSFRGNSMTQMFTATVEGPEMTGTISGGPRGERPFRATRRSG